MLAFSRQQVLDPVALDLSTVVKDLMGLMRRLVGADVELVVTLADCAGAVWADKGQLGQAVMNLVVNARDAMPRGGRITVETDRWRSPTPAWSRASVCPRVAMPGCGFAIAAPG